MVLSLFLICSGIAAQVMIEAGPPPNPRDGFGNIVVYGSDGLKKNIPYDVIKGSAFWKNDWQKAFFFDTRDSSLGSYMAKFNMVTQEAHYLDRNGVERAVIPGELNAVVFMSREDSTKIEAVFKTNIPEIRRKTLCKNCFAQELNQGHTKLLKITQKRVSEEDSLFGTKKKYTFVDDVEYFIQTDDQYNRLKKLNKDDLLIFLPGSGAYAGWIRKNGLRLNKEADCLVFLEHYNATHKKD